MYYESPHRRVDLEVRASPCHDKYLYPLHPALVFSHCATGIATTNSGISGMGSDGESPRRSLRCLRHAIRPPASRPLNGRRPRDRRRSGSWRLPRRGRSEYFLSATRVLRKKGASFRGGAFSRPSVHAFWTRCVFLEATASDAYMIPRPVEEPWDPRVRRT